MIFARARAVADAVLFEGYALYPYRASSVKNQRRWLFGTLLPRDVAAAQGEPSRLCCTCLLEGEEAEVNVLVRFLRFEARASGSWEEAAAEEVRVGPLRAGEIAAAPRRSAIALAGGSAVGEDGVARSRAAVAGEITIAAERVAEGILALTASVENVTEVAPGTSAEAARRSAMGAAHAIFAVKGGAFVSLVDPPHCLRAAAERVENRGAWPVLAGAPGDRDLVLCSPIILPDHPAVAPESAGDLFDATEMDEMLTLRILTMTEEEKREAAAGDARVRALLDRTHGLGPEAIARMHGAVRRFGPARRARVGGVDLGPGDRVRLRPRGRSDILDLALEGQEATIASVEQDYEDRTFFTVTVDADPGRDLGARGMPGHRFFFRPDEIEPLGGGRA